MSMLDLGSKVSNYPVFPVVINELATCPRIASPVNQMLGSTMTLKKPEYFTHLNDIFLGISFTIKIIFLKNILLVLTQWLDFNFRLTASYSCYGKKELMLLVVFGGTPMAVSLGTFSMFMYRIFPTAQWRESFFSNKLQNRQQNAWTIPSQKDDGKMYNRLEAGL